ncbi:GNAT family N-acetyltransferase [Shimazuella sp. AN120528]|nr:GNAT family N-acetyltransferase [Shimazuella soli]
MGGHRVTANSLICINGRQEKLVAKKLIQSARVYAAKKNYSGVIWPFLSVNDANKIAEYCPDARVILHSADPILHVPAGGFLQLTRSAKRSDRKKWLQEIKSFHSYGATVEWKSLDIEMMQFAGRLIAENRRKYGSSGGLEWMTRTFSAQLESKVAEKAVVALCRLGSSVKAIAIFYRHRDWLYGRYWGSEKDHPPYSYYVLTQYAALDWASQHGFRHIHLSISAWESKVRRGAVLYPLAMVILPIQNKPNLVSKQVAYEHNMSVVEHWKNRFATRPEGLDLSWSNW